MKVIVHDLQETSWQDLGIRFNERDVIIGKAAYNDKYSTSSSIAEVIGNCCQLVLISRCVYGGFSPFIQKVLECCRDRFGPFLEMRYGQTHYEVQNENKNILAWSAVSMGIILHQMRNNLQEYSLYQMESHCRQEVSKLCFMIQQIS